MTREFANEDLRGARFRNVDLSGATFKEAMMVNARISGLIDGLVVNDIEVGPLIDAELTRRYPERAKLRPRDADGVREAWAVIETLWRTTKGRMLDLPDATLRVRVDGEWSALETFRHLVMVTDAWIVGRVFGREGKFHPIGIAPTFITDLTPFGFDPAADPDLAEVVKVRESRLREVGDYIATITNDELKRDTGGATVRDCLWTLFDEEWHHNWYANRDLDALQ